MTYQESLEYLYNRLPVFHLTGAAAYKPGLDNTIALLNALDNPQEKFRSIHIAGTNGKGSVSHMLASILQENGYKTGLYTSPHLVHFGERIRINGTMVDEQFVIEFVERTKELVSKIEPSFFELTMAMSFLYFAENQVDIAVVEAGLGGRLDSTNILKPEMSIITNIGLEHTEFLGNTLQLIAGEKAGIIKSNTPVVIGEYLDETKNIFAEKATEKNSSIYFASDNFKAESQERDIDFQHFQVNQQTFAMDLLGKYQAKNLCTVLQSVNVLRDRGFVLESDKTVKALSQVQKSTGLRGRWETVGRNPQIVADTAHNPNGIRELCDHLALMNSPLYVLIGMAGDKDVDQVLSILPPDNNYIFTQANSKRAFSAAELYKKGLENGLKCQCIPSIPQAIDHLKNILEEKDFLLITGSNFVVGEALEYLDNKPQN